MPVMRPTSFQNLAVRSLQLAVIAALALAPRSAIASRDAEVAARSEAPSFTLQWIDAGGRLAAAEARSSHPKTRALRIPIDGHLVTLRLAPHSVRSAGFRLLVPDAVGTLREVAAPEPATVRGVIDELPGAVVAGSLEAGRLSATIVFADGRMSSIEPLAATAADRNTIRHRVVRADLELPAGACFVNDAPQSVPPAPHSGYRIDAAPRIADIAVDADFEYVGMNGGSVTSTVNDIEALLNSVNVVYERDCDLRHRLVTLIVRSAEPDPYSSTDAVTLYSQLRNHWNASQTAVQRDLVHLMTGKELAGSTIGYAAVGEVCNRSRAYGLTQARFTTNLARRTALVAHELGHNWNAVHCDAVSPCHIMCSSLGDCDFIGLPNFEPMGIDAIRAFASSRSCLADIPVAVETDPGPGEVRFAITGPNPFTRQTRVEYHLPQPAPVRLAIFDVSGQRIATLVDGDESAGSHSRTWDGADARGVRRAGVFYVRLETRDTRQTRTLIVIR